MSTKHTPEFVAKLIQRNEALERLVLELREKIMELESKLAAAQKTSRNSSKPPSSDITKPRPSTPQRKDG